ncbi:hypothetical protein OS493_002842 [Desmophyllum pertusum]|uniref:Uncharacterized protein n=1 Tax=Desmophyllum pertusum TaxID=174260 RepID=A0A9X0CG73_9CNID|nr:hypothetical protein OS493_002842 [Desmophyllum pertusum]
MEARYLIPLLILVQLCYQVEAWQCSNCEVPYKARGCYKDSPARVFKEQVLNERDPKSKVYGGRRIDWTDWNNYMQGFACRCAKIVKDKGWKVFGLQFYGECWSGAPGTYDLDSMAPTPAESCVADNYKKCGKFDRNCIGKQWKNFVYELETDCALGFEWIGCFKDDKKDPRPLPDYIMTDRERRLKIYSGQSIDWRNWDVYLPQFVCRCATLAKEKGHDTFSVQYYGECWSGSHSELTYAKIGLSENCQDRCFEKCKPFERFCAGKNYANAVYRLSDAKCEISYEVVGCHGENSADRALTEELLDEVKPYSHTFNGVMMEFEKNWEQGFTKFLCRCARTAHFKGYTMFGVYNNGECWSDSKAEQNYNKHGPSDKCFQNYNQTCPQDSTTCAGGAEANYVYRIVMNTRRSLFEDDKVPDVTSTLAQLWDLRDTIAGAKALRRRKREHKADKRFPFDRM